MAAGARAEGPAGEGRRGGRGEDATIRELLHVAQRVLAEVDVEVVLDRVLDAARSLTGGRYAALGVLDAERTGLERFVTSGLDRKAEQAIGAPPQGYGVLGS